MSAKFILHQPLSSNPRTKCARAFTRIELVAAVVGMALLCVVTLPLLGTTRSDSDRSTCFNNLRQIGRAVQMWGADHKNDPPWRTSVSDGGEGIPGAGSGFQFRAGAAWIEFAYMSNEVVTPRILACPADMEVKVASEFSDDAARGGYTAASFRALATSYFLNLHTVSTAPASVLCGDRNEQFSPTIGSCLYGPINIVSFFPYGPGPGWTNAVHGVRGQIVRMDGSVFETTSEQLRAAFRLSDENNPSHLLRAR